MSAAFTPGPWVAREDHPENSVIHVFAIGSEFDCEVATLFGSRSSPMQANAEGMWGADPERLANAHLIAAAPAMLAALQGVVRVADRATDEFDAARAAILAATGATQ